MRKHRDLAIVTIVVLAALFFASGFRQHGTGILRTVSGGGCIAYLHNHPADASCPPSGPSPTSDPIRWEWVPFWVSD